MFAATVLLAASPESLLEVRGEGDARASLAAVADVLVDATHEQAGFDGVSDARILRTVSDTEYVLYAHVGTPPPLTDRELVVAVSVSVEVDPAHRGLRIDMHGKSRELKWTAHPNLPRRAETLKVSPGDGSICPSRWGYWSITSIT